MPSSFFKDALIQCAVALVLELHWDSIKSRLGSDMRASALLFSKSLKKENTFPSNTGFELRNQKGPEINENFITQGKY